MTSRRSKVRCDECPKACFCGSAEHLEQNHLGGWRHAPWLFLPFCQIDHSTFHVMCRRAGVNFSPAPNKSLALLQALKAILVGLWMVVNELEEHLKMQLKKGKKDA